ncbi:MAG: DUF5710 domain-containing protein [Methylococcales bacterium]|nr:hypothetical protein [Methylotenera sp.]
MIASSNIALKVPFNEKDQAKSLGARWNAEAKQWYVPQGVEAAPFEKWFTDATNAAPTHAASKPATKTMPQASAGAATQNTPLGDDIDAINARLRDAYEAFDGDAF